MACALLPATSYPAYSTTSLLCVLLTYSTEGQGGGTVGRFFPLGVRHICSAFPFMPCMACHPHPGQKGKGSCCHSVCMAAVTVNVASMLLLPPPLLLPYPHSLPPFSLPTHTARTAWLHPHCLPSLIWGLFPRDISCAQFLRPIPPSLLILGTERKQRHFQHEHIYADMA